MRIAERLAVIAEMGRQEWRESAVCRQVDPDLWFPEQGQPVGDAKRLCRACPVRPECLAYALAADEQWGVWGGLTFAERRRVARRAADGEAAA